MVDSTQVNAYKLSTYKYNRYDVEIKIQWWINEANSNQQDKT